ncbi:hypothetical protein DKX38_018242 [Salix brachista]|uniref:Uncharacterized protein n=1 Tax=Salix brachista TaxID=2182728 RepID=A0A5N5KMI3_9ROSI|nr:hypothetical protein DKX38_018242 [Salix brachista]
MGYVLRVRLASFFAGAATASFAGLYFLYKDFKVAHDAISQQCYPVSVFVTSSDDNIVKETIAIVLLLYNEINSWVELLALHKVFMAGIILKGRTMVSFFEVESVHESLDRRISSLEKLKQSEAPQPLQATE